MKKIIIVLFIFLMLISLIPAVSATDIHLTVTICRSTDESVTPGQSTGPWGIVTHTPLGPGPDGWAYPLGSVVQLRAIPATDYHFSHWSWCYNGMDANISITIDGNRWNNPGILAVFAADSPGIINSFTAAPLSLPAGGGDVTFTWSCIANYVTLFLNGQNVGQYEPLWHVTVGITQTTDAYIVATDAGGPTTSNTITITVATAAAPGGNGGTNDKSPTGNSNLQGINWLYLIIPVGIVLLGIYIFVRKMNPSNSTGLLKDKRRHER